MRAAAAGAATVGLRTATQRMMECEERRGGEVVKSELRQSDEGGMNDGGLSHSRRSSFCRPRFSSRPAFRLFLAGLLSIHQDAASGLVRQSEEGGAAGGAIGG